MSIDLDELEKLARAATPGPWRWGDWSATFGTHESPDRMRRLERNLTHHGAETYVRQRGDGAHEVLCLEEPAPRDENAAYIAAASPDVVLSLIERVRDPMTFWRSLSSEQRRALVAEVCYSCGDLDPFCQCGNDE